MFFYYIYLTLTPIISLKIVMFIKPLLYFSNYNSKTKLAVSFFPPLYAIIHQDLFYVTDVSWCIPLNWFPYWFLYGIDSVSYLKNNTNHVWNVTHKQHICSLRLETGLRLKSSELMVALGGESVLGLVGSFYHDWWHVAWCGTPGLISEASHSRPIHFQSSILLVWN